MIYDRYHNKDKRDEIGGIIITRRDVIRVTRREQLCIFMKDEDFEDHELHCVQKWVIFIREGSEAHAFKDREEKEEGGEVAVESDARETPINATTREDINALLAYGYAVNDDRIPVPENTPSNTGKTEQPVYKEGGKWNVIDYKRASGCQLDAGKLDGISVLNYLT